MYIKHLRTPLSMYTLVLCVYMFICVSVYLHTQVVSIPLVKFCMYMYIDVLIIAHRKW